MTSTVAAPTRVRTTGPRTRQERRLRFRRDIEGMRAVAVGLVVAYHAGVPFLRGGFVGVDVFFVLSGFLITGLLLDELARSGRISLKDFYARRVRRLLPLAALVVTATALGSFLLLPPIDRGGLVVQLVAAMGSVANWVFAAQSTQYMAATDQSPVLHYWSLSVEEQFYLLWPLALLLVAGRGGLATRAWPVVVRRLVLVLGVIGGLSLFLSWQQTASASTYAYFGLHTRAWELAVGAALALGRPALQRVTRRAARLCGTTGLLLVVAAAVGMNETTPFPGLAATVPVLGTALLVVAGARDPNHGVSGALSGPVLGFVGRVSYAWYLWHWPVLVLANAKWGTPEQVGGPPRVGFLATTALVALSFLLAVASHYAVEQPLRRAKLLLRSRERTFVLGGALATVALVSSTALAVPSSSQTQDRVAAVASEQPATTLTNLKACYNDYTTTSVPAADVCRIGPKDGARRIALIGDSHSQHWMPALERLAAERGWTVYLFAKSSCAVVDVPVWLASTRSEYASCATWRESMVQRLAGMRVDAVLIGRWMDYRDLVLDDGGQRLSRTEAVDAWQGAATRTFARLKETAPRIIVIRDTPRPAGVVPSCVSRNQGVAAKCAFDKVASTGLDAGLARAEKAADPARVRFVDLTAQLCPTARCPVEQDGVLMYRDAHHLTVQYAKTLAEPLGDAISAQLR